MNSNTQAQANTNYFDSVMYARAYINEVKIISPPKKGDKYCYCAVNASIIDSDNDGNKVYRTVDLIVRGDAAKKLLWKLREKWPTDRFKKSEEKWIADINIGSPSHGAFAKKNGEAGATLKGRLINIRNLRIGEEDILGEITNEVPKPLLVTPCYVNLIDVDKGTAKVGILDGKIGEHTCQNVNLTFDSIEAFTQLEKQGLCPKGFEHRESNAKIFGVMEIENFRTEGFKTEKGELKSCLRGTVANVRYLKVNGQELMGKFHAFPMRR